MMDMEDDTKIGCLIWVGFFAAFLVFSQAGIGAAISTAIIYFAAIILHGKYKEAKRLALPCEHGTKGALNGKVVCQSCVVQRELQEISRRLAQKEKEKQLELEKKRQLEELMKKTKTKEFLLDMHPRDFENLVCGLFQKMGYEVEGTPYQGDNGIDGFLRKDGKLSILQCKRCKGQVGEPILRDLFGTMHAEHADDCVVVTTGNVSSKARQWSEGKPIRIIEAGELNKLIRTYFAEKEGL